MTQRGTIANCAWCGRAFALSGGLGAQGPLLPAQPSPAGLRSALPGDPHGAGPGEALVDAEALCRLRDRLYVLESALDDVEGDLRSHPGPEEYSKGAFPEHLYAAAAPLRSSCVEPAAVLRPGQAD